MKGQQEVLTPILLTGIMIAVISSVYFWGMPLIEKNKDAIYLRRSETFMNNLADKIKYVAANGGREEIIFNLPGSVRFLPDENYIELTLKTDGTIYSTGGDIYFTLTSTTPGILGKDEPFILKAHTSRLNKNYLTSYSLQSIPLCSGTRCYEIDFEGKPFEIGSGNHKIVIENVGMTGPVVSQGYEYTYSNIKISFS